MLRAELSTNQTMMMRIRTMARLCQKIHSALRPINVNGIKCHSAQTMPMISVACRGEYRGVSRGYA